MQTVCDDFATTGRSARGMTYRWWIAVGIFFVCCAPAFAKCLPMADIGARATLASLPAEGSVRLTFFGHSSFLIETPAGVSVVTDYNGLLAPSRLPQIVTMNNAHDTHYTDFPEPEIEHVLRGWDPGGGIASHDLKLKDLHVWNLPTNVRSVGGTRYNGNSIFVFETVGLCIAHLGHLHHDLTDEDLGTLGLIDILLAPADGVYTMGHEQMVRVIEQIRPRVVIPMHYFDATTLARFLHLLEGSYRVRFQEAPVMTFSRLSLPYAEVIVLPGR